MAEVMIRTVDLRKEFSGFRAVDGVNLEIAGGSIHAIIGPNGAGKTTVFNMLTKFLPPTAGEIILQGTDITRSSAADVACLGMIRSFQISSTFNRLTALQNVRVALMRPGTETYRFWRSHRDMERYNEHALSLLRSVGLEKWAHHQASVLPYGRKRALEIATTLALDPKVLLLDEPTAGMAQEDIEQIVTLIKSLGGKHTIVIVEHNLKVVSTLADRISVMARGRIIAEGPYSEVSQNPEVRTAYLGSAYE